MPAFNYDRAAKALVDAVAMGDRGAAEVNGCTTRAIRKWRRRLKMGDEKLLASFTRKMDAVEKGWAHRAPEAIAEGIEFILRAAQEGNHQDPRMVEAITGSVERLSEIVLLKETLDARTQSQLPPVIDV